jgi:hypothetical protein
MLRLRTRTATLALIVMVGAGCSSASRGPTPGPAAASYQEFLGAYCLAWESLLTAVGNLETGEDAVLVRLMDDAIARGDLASVDAQATRITAELDAGRRQLRIAGGWEPGTRLVLLMDRVLIAAADGIEARRAAAPDGLQAAETMGQAASEASGLAAAWHSLLSPETADAIFAARPPTAPLTCATVPLGR